jgi:DNA-binding LacI/PurR family transcriptional regulator
MKNKRSTMVEIARYLGISRTTVSVCLTGNPQTYKIRPETVERVQNHARRIGYVPNASARNLVMRGGANALVGLLMPGRGQMEKNVGALNYACRLLETSGRQHFFLSCETNKMVDAIVYCKGGQFRDRRIYAGVSCAPCDSSQDSAMESIIKDRFGQNGRESFVGPADGVV